MNPYLNLNDTQTITWVEKYRPKKIDDVLSHDTLINSIKKFLNNNTLPHMLFYGPPGTGKTSLINNIVKEIYGKSYTYMSMEINASEERGIEVVRNRIMQFAYSKNIGFDKNEKIQFKIIILDEVDSMTLDAQASLRRIIEKYTKYVRFCLICNYIKKIDIALQSRCTLFRFTPLTHTSCKHKIMEIIKKEKIKYTKEGIDNIINKSKGDMRKVINILHSTHIIYNLVNINNVNRCLSHPTTNEIKIIFDSLINDNFEKSVNIINNIKYKNGYNINDILEQIFNHLISLLNNNKYEGLNETIISKIISNIANIEYNGVNNNNDYSKISSLVATFKIYT